jgi:excisionase family DNA binding protein
VTELHFLTVPEVADLFGVSERTVLREIDRGELRAFRVGVRNYRVDLEAIREYVQGHPVRPGELSWTRS